MRSATTLEYSCGHTALRMTRSASSASYLQRYAKERPCHECQRSAHAQRIQAATLATETLPALIGTEKQVDWAIVIRADAAGGRGAVA